MSFINCRGKLIDLSTPKVMGILNITPDSFYDGGKYQTLDTIVEQVGKMLTEGATFIDVGAISSRPGASEVSAETESALLLPVIKLLVKEFKDIIISVDTFRSSVARQSINNGASIVNDICAGTMDDAMFQTVADLQVPYIMMHMQGSPHNMQLNPQYNNVVKEILQFFSARIVALRKLGIHDIVTDVGFGFGKSIEHNYSLLRNLSLFKETGLPILVGLSRKSMLYNPLAINADEALNATTAAHTIALLNGASILRVHDVKEAIEAIKITTCYKNSTP